MSKAYILVEVVALVLVASRAYSAETVDCTRPQTQDALTACLTRELSEADARLNEVYTKIVSRRTGAERESLRTAQREWMRDRDKECGTPPTSSDRASWYAAVSRNGGMATCMISETRYRSAVLEAADKGQPPPSREDAAWRSALYAYVTTVPDQQGRPRPPTLHHEGRWYFEVTIDRQAAAPLEVMAGFADEEQFIGTAYQIRTSDRGLLTIGCAIDLDAGMAYFLEGGSWHGKEPGSNLGMAVKLGRYYKAQVRTNERISALLESGAVRPNYGDTPFVYPPPAGYRSWR